MHLHKWSNWEEATFIITNTEWGREQKTRRAAQKRTCLKCNLVKVRYLLP